MTVLIGFVSQKGGVGKSTLCKLIAREYAVNGWEVKIADMDTSQGTTYNWNSRRLQNNIEPNIPVEQFRRVEDVLRISNSYDMILFDGAPHATRETLKIAQACQLVVLPTGISLDDLEPTVKLAHELVHEGINRRAIGFALCRVGNSSAEIHEATEYLKATGYHIFDGMITEKTGYRRASDLGKTLTETTHATLNQQAELLAQSIINKIQEFTTHG